MAPSSQQSSTTFTAMLAEQLKLCSSNEECYFYHYIHVSVCGFKFHTFFKTFCITGATSIIISTAANANPFILYIKKKV